MHEMSIKLNRVLRYYWTGIWLVVTPIACLAVFIFIMTDIGPTEYNGKLFPAWADALGWMMGASTLAPFPIFAVYQYIKHKDSTRTVSLILFIF